MRLRLKSRNFLRRRSHRACLSSRTPKQSLAAAQSALAEYLAKSLPRRQSVATADNFRIFSFSLDVEDYEFLNTVFDKRTELEGDAC